MKTVKLSSKGQLTLPIETLRALGATKGTEFLLLQEADRIVLIPARAAGRRLIDELGGWEALSAAAFETVWDNEADEVWNDA